MIYKCTYTSGSNTEYDDGNWIIKMTPKTTTLTKIGGYLGGIYAMHKVGEKIRVGFKTGNPIKYIDEKTGTFVVYFQQAGTPYYFEPIK